MATATAPLNTPTFQASMARERKSEEIVTTTRKPYAAAREKNTDEKRTSKTTYNPIDNNERHVAI